LNRQNDKTEIILFEKDILKTCKYILAFFECLRERIGALIKSFIGENWSIN
jgi:hypothetical protein